MSGGRGPKERRKVTEDERDRLTTLYAAVPKVVTQHHIWRSPEGQAFLGYVRDLCESDVPLSWVAQIFPDLSWRALQQVLLLPPQSNTNVPHRKGPHDEHP